MDENQNMSHLQTNQEVDDIPLEVLRAKYLKKKPLFSKNRYSSAKSVFSPTSSQKENNAPPQTQSVVQRLIGQRSRLELARDLLLLISVFVLGILAIFSFATPTTEIGGEAAYGETQTLYGFLWKADDSIRNQTKAAIEQIEHADFDEDDASSVISAVMKLIRLLFLAIAGGIVAIKTIAQMILAAYGFYTQNTMQLGRAAVRNIAQNMIAYIFFAFFGSMSGGMGQDAYFVGYTVGTGMTVGMLLGILMLIAAAVCTFIMHQNQTKLLSCENIKWIKILSAGLGYAGVAIMLTFMKIYSVFVYVFTASLSSAVASIQNGFDIKAFIFPVLNLLLFIICLNCYSKAKKGFTVSFEYALFFANKNCDAKARLAIDKASYAKFISIIIYSVLSVGIIYVLSNPEFGFGWSIDVYKYFVWIFVVASIAQTIWMTLSDEKKPPQINS